MNIKKTLRSHLLKEGAHKDSSGNKFGCVMILLSLDKNNINIINDDDVYEPEGETGFGKEKEQHVTILYGLHNDIPDEDIENEIDEIKIPKIKLGKISSFENEKFDVLKYDVESDDLGKLNEKFKKFPNTNSYPDYHPHVTIAYVKKGSAKKYIDKLNEVSEIEVKPDEIVYSKANGTKKRYDF